MSGSAYVSACVLPLVLADGKTQVARFRNDDLVAVTQTATYLEEFEFKLDASRPIDPKNVDGTQRPLFEFMYWGKPDRNTDPQPITGGRRCLPTWAPAGIARRAMTIPRGLWLRTFEIGKLTGTFAAQDALVIRKHKAQPGVGRHQRDANHRG